MVYAAIDMGSNSVRLLVGNVSDSGLEPLRYERETTRIARGMEGSGVIGKDAMDTTIEVLRRYSGIIRAYGAVMYRAVGTSALREASNAREFLGRVRSETGIDVEVVTGAEEAGIMAVGVVLSLPAGGASLILDIGGGSTEVVLCRGAEVLDALSLPVGAVKLLERSISGDPPSVKDKAALDRECLVAAQTVRDGLEGEITPDTRLIGTAGTITTLACIDMGLDSYDRSKVHGHVIPLERLRRMSAYLFSLPLCQRSLVRGLEPARADLIITGLTLTIRLMETLGFVEITISDSGLLEGVLFGLASEDLR